MAAEQGGVLEEEDPPAPVTPDLPLTEDLGTRLPVSLLLP